MSRRLLPLLAVAALAGCGVRHGDADRDQVTADTCLSTIVRAGLPAPTPEQISPERFAAERRRLLESGKRYNTVSPYKNACNEIKEELQRQRRQAQAEAVAGALLDGGGDADSS